MSPQPGDGTVGGDTKFIHETDLIRKANKLLLIQLLLNYRWKMIQTVFKMMIMTALFPICEMKLLVLFFQ